MAKRASTRAAKKAKKPRTSTIDQTIASAAAGFKKQKKPTKTRTMVQTIKEGQPKPVKVPQVKKAKKTPKKKAARKTKKVKKSKK